VLVFLILMPLLVFSPITPFNDSLPIEMGTAELDFGVATSCTEGMSRTSCRAERIILFQAPASQIITYNNSRLEEFVKMNPKAHVDIDVQEVIFPPDSRRPLEVSVPVGLEVQRLLDVSPHLPVAAFVELRLHLTREGPAAPISTNHKICFCAPEGCAGSTWPAVVKKVCGTSIQSSSVVMANLRKWWLELGRGETVSVRDLRHIWDTSVRVGSGKPEPQNKTLDMTYSVSNCSRNCEAGWCTQAHCWGTLRTVPLGKDESVIVYELERSASLGSLSETTTSFSVAGLYIAVVLVFGRYLRAAFQDSSKRAIYEEIPDVGAFLDLVTAIKLAREHKDLRTEFQLYYCLMKVLRSTNLLLTTGGHEPSRYGAGRYDPRPPECEEPRSETRLSMDAASGSGTWRPVVGSGGDDLRNSDRSYRL